MTAIRGTSGFGHAFLIHSDLVDTSKRDRHFTTVGSGEASGSLDTSKKAHLSFTVRRSRFINKPGKMLSILRKARLKDKEMRILML